MARRIFGRYRTHVSGLAYGGAADSGLVAACQEWRCSPHPRAGWAIAVARIATGEPLPLLQFCAAVHNMPLIVYTNNKPHDRTLPFTPEMTFEGSISAIPAEFNTNPVDIAVWLGLTGTQLGNVQHSNATVLTDIGNTVGSHVDPEVTAIVQSFRTHRGGATVAHR